MQKQRVLFLCTGNSARSQMAEGILRREAGDKFEVYSAGTNPSFVQPNAIAVMQEIGIDISEQRSKSAQEFTGETFDFVITVCSKARENCPLFPGAPEHIAWDFEDPVQEHLDSEQSLRLFRRVRNEIQQRIRLFVTSQKAG